MGKRFFLGLVVTLAGLFGAAMPVYAHVEAGNNGVLAVMHIVPDDSPTAGKPTIINFAFGGTANDFSILTCGCKLQVTQDSKQVASSLVEAADETITNGVTSVTFPDEDVYKLAVTGTAGARHFAIPFLVRVNPAGGSANTAAGTNVLMVGLASLALVAVIAYYYISKGGRYAAKTTK
jgi:hypothetical protein